MMSQLPIDDDHAPLCTLGQVADMLRVQQAFLRRLDQHDVISPRSSPEGQRRYSRRDTLVVRHVIGMTDQGMTLVAVRRILELEAELDRLREELAEERRRQDRPD